MDFGRKQIWKAKFATILLSALGLSACLGADNWPFFKNGIERNSESSAILQDNLFQKWIGNSGQPGVVTYSSPVVFGDRVFIANTAGQVKCFDLSPSPDYLALHNGKNFELWSYQSSAPIYGSPGAAMVGGELRVFAGTTDGKLLFLKGDTTNPAGEPAGPGSVQIGGAVFSSPLVVNVPTVGDVVFISTNSGKIVALHADTGQTHWTNTVGGYFHSGLVYDSSRHFIILAAYDGLVRAFDAGAGGPVWSYQTGATRATPSLAMDVVFNVTRGGLLEALSVSSVAPLRVLASKNLGTATAASPAVRILSCSGSCVLRVVLLLSDGHVVAYDYNTGSPSFTLAWSFPPAPINVAGNATVAISSDKVYVGRHDGSVVVLNLLTGLAKPHLSLPNSVQTSAAAVQNSLFFGHSGGELRAYGNRHISYSGTPPTGLRAGDTASFQVSASDSSSNRVHTYAGTAIVTVSGQPGADQIQFENGAAQVSRSFPSSGTYTLRVTDSQDASIYGDFMIVVSSTTTPTQTPTATPSPTATPTFNPCFVPNGQGDCPSSVVFFDTFASYPTGPDVVPSGWINEPGGTAQIAHIPEFGGNAFWLPPRSGSGNTTVFNTMLTDMEIESDVLVYPGAWAALLVRVQVSSSFYWRYHLIYFPDSPGTAIIQVRKDGDAFLLAQSGPIQHNSLCPVVRMRFSVRGERMEGCVGQECISATLPNGLITGNVGMDTVGGAAFDNVRINLDACWSPTSTFTATPSDSPTPSQTTTPTASPSATPTITPTSTVTPPPSPVITPGYAWDYYWYIVVQNRQNRAFTDYTVQLSDGSGFVDLASRVADGKLRSDGADIRIFDDQGQEVAYDLVTDPENPNAILRMKVSLAPGQQKIYRMDFGNPAASVPAGYGSTAYLSQVYDLADAFDAASFDTAKFNVVVGTPAYTPGTLSLPLPFELRTVPTFDTSYGGRFEFTGNGGSNTTLDTPFRWQIFEAANSFAGGKRQGGVGFEVAGPGNSIGADIPAAHTFGPVENKWMVLKPHPRAVVVAKDSGDPYNGGSDFNFGISASWAFPDVAKNPSVFRLTGGSSASGAVATFKKIVGYHIEEDEPTATLLGDEPFEFGAPVTNDPVPETRWNGHQSDAALGLTLPSQVQEIRGFSDPVDVTVANGLAFVLDRQAGHIKVLRVQDFGLERVIEAGLKRPEALNFDHSRGWIWVADTGNSRVLALGIDGAFKREISIEDPAGVATDDRGRMYVSSRSMHQIQAFNGNLQHEWTRGSQGYEINRFESPGRVVVAESGLIHVSDPGNDRIATWDSLGYPVRQLPRTSVAPFVLDHASGLAMTQEHCLMALDLESGKLACVDGNGQLVGISSSLNLDHPEGIWAESHENMWVADTGNRRVLVLRTTAGQGGDGHISSLPAKPGRPSSRNILPQGKSAIVYPNPANSSATAAYRIVVGSKVKLSVVNVAGEQVLSSSKGWQAAGEYEERMDTSGLGSGLYFLLVSTDEGMGMKVRHSFKWAVLR